MSTMEAIATVYVGSKTICRKNTNVHRLAAGSGGDRHGMQQILNLKRPHTFHWLKYMKRITQQSLKGDHPVSIDTRILFCSYVVSTNSLDNHNVLTDKHVLF